jgi:hypothetical protein
MVAHPINVIHAAIVLVDHPPHVTKETQTQQQLRARSVASYSESSTDSAIQQGPNSVPGPASGLQIGQEKVQTDPHVAVSAAAPDLSAASQRKGSRGSQHPAILGADGADGANDGNILNPKTPSGTPTD